MRILEDPEPEGRRCGNLFSFKGFHIGDTEFEGYCVIKGKDQVHAQDILERLLKRRGLHPYTRWPYTIREVGEITPPPKDL